MNRKLSWTFLLIILLGGVYLWRAQQTANLDGELEEMQEEFVVDSEESELPEIDVGLTQAQANNVNGSTGSSSADVVKVETADLATLVDQLALCLSIRGLQIPGRVSSSVENLELLLKPVSGEIAVQTDEWNATTIELPNGEHRSIKVDSDYSLDDEATQKLTLYKLEKDGSTSLIPLSEDQSKNPSEAFVASLEQDGRIISKQKKSNIYFTNGEEAAVIERDGVMIAMELSRNEKILKCTGLDSDKPTCQCSR